MNDKNQFQGNVVPPESNPLNNTPFDMNTNNQMYNNDNQFSNDQLNNVQLNGNSNLVNNNQFNNTQSFTNNNVQLNVTGQSFTNNNAQLNVTGQSYNIDGNNLSNKKRTNIIVPLLIIALIAILILSLVFFLNNKKEFNDNGKEVSNNKEIDKNKTSITAGIVDINLKKYSGIEEMAILLDDGTYYTINSKEMKVQKNTEIPFKVKKKSGNYYISEDNEVYIDYSEYKGISPVKYEGKYVKLYENIKDISAGSWGNLIALNDKNEVLAYNEILMESHYQLFPAGFDKRYNFDKIADNAKDIFIMSNAHGYVSNSNDLYLKKLNQEYTKILENVKSIEKNSFFTYVLTYDKVLYNLVIDYKSDDLVYDLTKISDNVDELYLLADNIYYEKDDRIYSPSFDGNNKYGGIADYDSDNNKYYISVEKASNIKHIIYAGSPSDSKRYGLIVYIDNDDVVHYYTDGKEEKTTKFDVDSMLEVIEFVNNR